MMFKILKENNKTIKSNKIMIIKKKNSILCENLIY